MVAPRRGSSRISQRQVTLVLQWKRKEHHEDMRRLASMKRRRKPMDVHVQILTGRCISLSVSPDDTIQQVTEKIQMKEGINPDQQLLLYNGRKLHMDCTVDDCNVQADSKLFLIVRGLGG
jgi:Ubiquitin family